MMSEKKNSPEPYPENFPRWLIPAITGFIAVAFGVFTYRQGIKVSSDTITYSGWSDLLINARFNYLEFARDASFVIPPVLYSGWVTVVALFKLLFGARWMAGIIVLNYGLELLAITLLLGLTKRITRSVFCVVTAGALTLVAYEEFQWIPYALSDTSFAALTFAVFYLLCDPSQKNPAEPGRALSRRNLILILLVALALLYRPTGLPVLVTAALAFVTRRAVQGKIGVDRARVARRIAAILSLLGICGVVLHAYFMKNPSAWPVNFASHWISRLSVEYHQGFVVYQRPETYYLNPASLLDFILITLKKLALFFSFYSGSFSAAHNLINFVFFFPVYALVLLAIYRIFRADDKLAPAVWWSGWIALWWTIFFALFHAFQQVDYDWRYRLPCMMPLTLLASIGLWSSALHGQGQVRERSLMSRPHPED